MFQIDNFTIGESPEIHEVYQRCIFLSGKCDAESECERDDSHVRVETKDEAGQPLFPEQRWPVSRGFFKALVLLTPGLNKVVVISGQDATRHTEIFLRYTPLLQTPPLHLAIMIAKDSPLLIDCPPAKYGSISSTHSSLDAVITKFRMTAYMWQALTAEDLRAKGLGRRSFRLEEEWTLDTLTRNSLHTPTMGPVPKIHLVRTDRTVAELRDANLAQQNPHAGGPDELHAIFMQALQAHGAPFTSPSPSKVPIVVAGLILDSHYSLSQNLILAHAALGAHHPTGDRPSLGMFGSHLTYAWPRFLEEVPDCLLDATAPGDTAVGNDNGECTSMWRACAVGQGAFLHEVGHAFGLDHTSGIMERGYSPDWARVFLARTAMGVIDKGEGEGEHEHECRWDVGDALKFRNLPHFRLPGDKPIPQDGPVVSIEEEMDSDEATRLKVECKAGIARVVFIVGDKEKKRVEDKKLPFERPNEVVTYRRHWTRHWIEGKFGAGQPLGIEVTAMNGKQHAVANVWKLFTQRTSIIVPGTKIRLLKQSVCNDNAEDEEHAWPWAVMLKKRDREGKLVDASKIDLRVGCALDGAIVHYKDGKRIPCGRRGPKGKDPHMGGHQARKLVLPEGEEIVKVAVMRTPLYGNTLRGLRMWLSNGQGMGALNWTCRGEVDVLVPPPNHRIIGFYGLSGRYGMCFRFGIVTAPRDVELPDSLYDMEELQNKPELAEHRDKRRRSDSECRSEDEEDGEESDNESVTSASSWRERDDAYDDHQPKGIDAEMDKAYQL